MTRARPAAAGAPALVALLAGLLAITPLSIDMPLPALPQLARALGTTAARAQLVVSAFLAGFATGQLAYGPLSDRLGRRRVLLGGIALYLAGGLACLAAPSIEWLVAARVAQGLGACAGPVMVRAVVRDLHEGARAARVLSLTAMGSSLAPMLAPVIGGVVLLRADWRAIFAVLVLVGTALLAGVYRLLPETNVDRDPSAVHPGRLLANYLAIASHRTFARYVLTLGAGSVGLFAYISGSPFVLMSLHGLAPHLFGLAFAAVAMGQLSGAVVSARLTVRLGIDTTVRTGLACYLAGGAALALLLALGVRHVAAVVAPMAVFMLGNGMVMPNCQAGAVLPFRRMAGAASALAGFVQMGIGAMTGLALARLHDGTARPMTLMVLGAAVIGVLAFTRLRPRSAAGAPAV